MYLKSFYASSPGKCYCICRKCQFKIIQTHRSCKGLKKSNISSNNVADGNSSKVFKAGRRVDFIFSGSWHILCAHSLIHYVYIHDICAIWYANITCEYSIRLSNSIYPEMASYPLNLHSFLCHISSKDHFNGKNGGNYNGKYKNKQDTTGDESKKKKN